MLKRWVSRVAKATGLLLLLVLVATVAACWSSFGHRATGARRDRMKQSPEWRGSGFVNPQPIVNHWGKMLRDLFATHRETSPSAPPPTVHPDLRAPPASGLRVTWLGHSTMLVEIDGQRILTDPVWSERASPLRWIGPRRWYPPPLPLDELPRDRRRASSRTTTTTTSTAPTMRAR